MKTEVLPDAEGVARRGAALIARLARDAIRRRGRFTVALSGGSTPWRMLQILAGEDIHWERVHLFQVDERLAPRGSRARNLTHLRKHLLDRIYPSRARLYPMPVDTAAISAAAVGYARTLERVTGSPAVLDLVHLGLGSDGHTASLVPGDAVVDKRDADVAVTREYRGWARMTLTFPVINRARRILWVVTGADKAKVLHGLAARDRSLPASRVGVGRASLLADRAAASRLPPRAQ